MRMLQRIGILVFVSVMLVPASVFAQVNVGDKAPVFTGTDSHGEQRSLSDFKRKYVVLEWFNPECPFVKKHYDTGNMQALQAKYTAQEVVWLTIDSSAPGNQGHLTPEEANQYILDHNTGATAFMVDATGEIGNLYGAKTTPHMYIIGPKGVLLYQGAIDDRATTDTDDVTGANNFVDNILSLVLADEVVEPYATKSYGCSVKY